MQGDGQHNHYFVLSRMISSFEDMLGDLYEIYRDNSPDVENDMESI